MDVGPRSSRPVERRAAATRQEPAYRQPEEKEAPKAVHRAVPHRVAKEEKSVWKRLLWPVVAVIVLAVAAAGWFAWSNMGGGAVAIDSNKYQAVFFTNGQVYFGKLEAAGSGYLKLTDVFYLQSQSSDGDASGNPQQSAGSQGNVQLIKLGEEIHGPEDEMIISKDQVLFYENLKSDGKVAQSIGEYKSK